MAQEINLVEIKDGYSQSNFNHNTKATIGAALKKETLRKSTQNHPKNIRDGKQFFQSDGPFSPSF